MKNLYRKKIIIVLILSVVLLLSVCFSLLFVKRVNAVQVEIIDSNIKTQYMMGDEIELGKVKLDYNGLEIESTGSYLIFPNGNAVRNEKITLSTDGGYTAVYYIYPPRHQLQES